MNFHPQKCKVLSVSNRQSPLQELLPSIQYYYTLGESPLEYVNCEKDLGVDINTKFNFNDQCNKLISKASQKFGLTKRTCSFVTDHRRRRVLYLTLIRSQFEHCSPVWRPTGKTITDKFESFQKSCIKWILSEENLNYYSYSNYINKCRQVNILPVSAKFDLNDLILFYKVIYQMIPLNLPDYLTLFDGNSRLRSCHLDRFSYVCSLQPKGTSNNVLDKSFFYRTHSLWNHLPLDIREINCASSFKVKVTEYLWKQLLNNNSADFNDSLEDFCPSDDQD